MLTETNKAVDDFNREFAELQKLLKGFVPASALLSIGELEEGVVQEAKQ